MQSLLAHITNRYLLWRNFVHVTSTRVINKFGHVARTTNVTLFVAPGQHLCLICRPYDLTSLRKAELTEFDHSPVVLKDLEWNNQSRSGEVSVVRILVTFSNSLPLLTIPSDMRREYSL